MKKKKIALLLLAVACIVSCYACGTNSSTQKEEETVVDNAETEEAPAYSGTEEETASENTEEEQSVTGGWETYDKIEAASLTEESKTAFEKAMETHDGVALEPAALLATQVVAGTNYAYLAKAEEISGGSQGWSIVVVYNDLEGNCSVTSVKDIDPENPKTTEAAPDANLTGGWTIQPPSNAVTLPEDAWEAFGKASDAYEDAILSPLALLQTQVVAGTNYKIFCQGTTTGDEPADAFYLATLYADLEGNAEITEAVMLDFLSYIE